MLSRDTETEFAWTNQKRKPNILEGRLVIFGMSPVTQDPFGDLMKERKCVEGALDHF